MNINRSNVSTPVEKKRAAIADYDAWADEDLRPQSRTKLVYLAVGGAIAATVIIGATQLWSGDGSDEVDDRSAQSITLDPGAEDLAKQLKAMSLEDHMRVFRTTQGVLEDRLLTGPAKWSMRFVNQSPPADGGCIRILNYGQHGLVSTPGGGAYYSFTKRSNSLTAIPDIAMIDWSFIAGLGKAVGAVVRLPDMNSLSEVVGRVPAWMTRPPAEFAAEVKRRRPESAKAVVDGYYAVRSILWDRSDVLVGFQVYDRGTYGVSIGWTLIERGSVPSK